MHFLITGHTGFKGSWMTMLLLELGHSVSGVSLAPPSGGLFLTAGLEGMLKQHHIADIRDRVRMEQIFSSISPDVVVHMAAQPLVLQSYRDPTETFDVNVHGTHNILLAADNVSSIQMVLVVTTDKVYRDTGSGNYPETAPLGGFDPYSASKAMADLLSQSWGRLARTTVKIARAGNVVGGWDVSENRLLPDAVRAIRTNSSVEVRHPLATRPWQSVLDCVGGYYAYCMATLAGGDVPAVLNFGPSLTPSMTVSEVLSVVRDFYPIGVIELQPLQSFRETSFLTLDSSLSRNALELPEEMGFRQVIETALLELRPDGMNRAHELVEGYASKLVKAL